MRHGEAVSYREPDKNRPLTTLGHLQCANVGKWLAKNKTILDVKAKPSDIKIDVALVSPYLRTQESFLTLSEYVSVGKHITLDSITPNGDVIANADLIHGYANDENGPQCMLIVTHMPLVTLLSDNVCPGYNALFFEPADTLIIDYSSDSGIGKKVDFFQGI